MGFFSSRLALPLVLIGLLSALSSAQTAPLAYRPVTAEFSKPLDRLILVSANPNRLHIYDPIASKDVTVTLEQPPLSLSLSPDGVHAAVGHDALISYVNLNNASVEKLYTVPTVASSIVAAASWLYVLPSYVGNSVSVNIATGAVTPNNSVFYGTKGWLNPSVNAIYGTRDGTSPNDIEEYDITTGPITRQFDSPYHGDYCIFGPVWFSPDGGRIYTGCGTVFRASTDPKLDMYYLSSIPGVNFVASLAESAAIQRVALISGAPTYSNSPANDGVIQLFESAYLRPAGQFTLSSFEANGTKFAAHGRSVFFNAASTEMVVLKQADQSSGLLNDFAVQRIQLSATAVCGAAFTASAANVPAMASSGSVKITAPSSCVYQATSLSPWVTILSGGYGAGDGTLLWSASGNSDSVARSGVILLGDQAFTVNQDASPASPAAVFVPGYYAVDAAYAKPTEKLILVSASPNQLHIYDPVTQKDLAVSLDAPPLSVSVRPDGLFAAVGHDGWVSLIDLTQGVVQKVFPVVTDVHALILAGNGYIYLFPTRDWSDIYSLEIGSGKTTATGAIYNGREPRLHVNGKSLYVGGNWQSKWDISQGVAKVANSQTAGCGKLWLTEDGRRMFGSCAKAYTTSEVPAQDLQYNGSLSNANSLIWADESAQQQATAVIPNVGPSFSTNSKPVDDTQVQIYGDAFLGYQGAIPLPKFTLGGNSFVSHGRFVFWNKSGSGLYVVVQADSKSLLSGGTGIVQLSLMDVRQVTVNAAVNSASQVQGRISPGELVSIYGTGMGSANGAQFALDSVTRKVNTNLAGTEVYFNGIAAPVLYASDTLVNAIVPFELGSSGQVTLQVGYQGILSTGTSLTMATAVPGIFTLGGSGSGQAVALNPDGTICDATHPAAPGSYITVYFTGGGATNPSGATGSVAGLILKKLTLTALATVGDLPATVTFAGAAPTIVEGVGQLNIRLDDKTPSGSAQPLILTVGSNSSPATATIAVR